MGVLTPIPILKTFNQSILLYVLHITYNDSFECDVIEKK